MAQVRHQFLLSRCSPEVQPLTHLSLLCGHTGPRFFLSCSPTPRHCPHGSHCLHHQSPFGRGEGLSHGLKALLEVVPTPLSSFHRRQEDYMTHLATGRQGDGVSHTPGKK